ncbi:hypothetical protein Achl_3986 (plasmid) [Pseudarthrobacter chlorophenolicus A6]|uniref:Uncharacterized protein n=1 Tax=Pseudarthrobacter chlorophenolicus (strain ATCC 700700 / DSM 12829 / CIP 107037 / JCM 12360 / KCTC 9906 / NCIMB 13794 / A6) TaxID=452863 RepID=B8HHP0_PSECP|nr:hypothetical protein [Pseudarthrobacter chlorophenolicus]ACL41937.1 hypothetical protein Achl_3986 [Pseudarthrobacter chlorophenolicus A6]
MLTGTRDHAELTLHETLTHLRDAAATFQGGTQITSREEAQVAGISYRVVEGLMALAKQNGATPYEISRAFQGEVIGSSFQD